MKFRDLNLEDIPLVAELYQEGAKNTSYAEVEARLRQVISGGLGYGGLVCEASVGEIIALIVAVPGATPGSSQLQVLAVPPAAQGRRLAKTLLIELKRKLLEQGVRVLWIDAEEKTTRTFVSIGAVEIGSAPPAQGSSQRRNRLRLLVLPRPDFLETERLLLREWRETDLPRFAELNAHPEVNRYLVGPLSTEESNRLADRFAREISHRGFGCWAVEKKAEGAGPGTFLGMVGLAPAGDLAPIRRHLGAPTLEVAWRLHPDSWGRGFATEAAASCVAYAFNQLGVQELVSFTVPENIASQRVMEKLGFERDLGGNFEHPHLPSGHPRRAHWLYRKKAC